MSQAADRRQLDAPSIPPSHPASGWRRDLPEALPDSEIKRVPSGTLRAASAAIPRRAPDRPALAMVLAPVIGAALWGGLAMLFF